MLNNFNLLTRHQLVSRVLQLNRQNNCMSTQLLRYQLLFNCYEKLCNVLQRNEHIFSNNNNIEEIDQLRQQIKLFNSTNVCEIKLNILNEHEIADNTKNNCDKAYINTIINDTERENIANINERNNLNLTKENDEELNSLCSFNSDLYNYSSNSERDHSINETKNNKQTKVKIENNNKKAEYVCDWIGCKRIFVKKRSLRNHIGLVHTNFTGMKEKVWKCDFDGCNYATILKDKLEFHRVIHYSGKSHYKCDYNNCLYSTNNAYSLRGHKLTIHPQLFPEIETINCGFDGCNFTTKLLKRLKRHRIGHQNLFKCKTCHKGFISSYSLNEHIVMHKQKGKYVCDYLNCEESFAISTDLIKHRYVHTKFICDWDDCNKSFKSPKNLRQHKAVTHQKLYKNTEYYCKWENCGKKYKNITTFNAHKNSHTGDRPFKCLWPGCDKCFTQQFYLTKHQFYHTNTGSNKLYQCSWPECNYGTNNKYNLNKHNDVHSGLKKHACDWPECSFSASNKSNLNTHKKSHIS